MHRMKTSGNFSITVADLIKRRETVFKAVNCKVKIMKSMRDIVVRGLNLTFMKTRRDF